MKYRAQARDLARPRWKGRAERCFWPGPLGVGSKMQINLQKLICKKLAMQAAKKSPKNDFKWPLLLHSAESPKKKISKFPEIMAPKKPQSDRSIFFRKIEKTFENFEKFIPAIFRNFRKFPILKFSKLKISHPRPKRHWKWRRND